MVFVYVHVSVGTHVYVCIQKLKESLVILRNTLRSFWDRSWMSLVLTLGCLTGKPQGSTCVCLSDYKCVFVITMSCFSTWCRGIKLKSLSLWRKHFTIWGVFSAHTATFKSPWWIVLVVWKNKDYSGKHYLSFENFVALW